MVQTDLTQFSRECNSWKENLRNYRSELSHYREKLQDVVSQQISKNELPNIEHYNNQFEIQLRNINQLKHAIKEHERTATLSTVSGGSNVSGTLWATHENLHDRYESLEHILLDLKQEFNSFVSKVG